MRQVYPPLILISTISTLLPLLVSLSIFRLFAAKLKNLQAMVIFFAFAVFAEVVLFLFSLYGAKSAWFFHLYTVIEFVLIMTALRAWQIEPRFARLVRMSIPFYLVCFMLIKIAGLESLETGLYNNVTRPLALLFLTIFALLTLQDLWRNTSTNLTDDYRFWMLLAMVIYYGASLGLFAFMFTKDRELLIILFKIHAVVNIIHNILFTIGVFQIRRAQQAALQPTSTS